MHDRAILRREKLALAGLVLVVDDRETIYEILMHEIGCWIFEAQ